jgi:hypothetical protein
MDLAALAVAQKKMAAKGSEGFLNQKDLTEEGLIVRLLPEPPEMDGIPYMEVQNRWVGGKTKFVDPSTFGEPSVIDEEIAMAIQKAKDENDADLMTLATDTTKDGVSASAENWIALLHLEYKTKKDEIVGYTVVDNTPKILACRTQLLSAILKIASSKKAARIKSPDKIADRMQGINMLIAKTGTGMKTKYSADEDEQMEIDERWYEDVPNVMEVARQQMALPTFQRASIRLYLYGTPIPAKVQAKEDARKEAVKAANALRKASIGGKSKAAVEDDDEEDDAPPSKKTVTKTVATAAKKKAAPVEDDEEDEDDEPAPKKIAKKPAAPVDEDEDDEDDTPPAKKPAPVAKKTMKLDADGDPLPPPSKAGKKVASVDLDDEDDEDDAPPPPPPPAKKSAKTATPPAKKPAAKIDLDDDDDDDEDEMPQPKKTAAKAPVKTAQQNVKSILDMDDDDDDE